VRVHEYGHLHCLRHRLHPHKPEEVFAELRTSVPSLPLLP
jgi:hypothetical protein